MGIVVVASELNELDIVWWCLLENLEVNTQEKVCFIAGPKFGPLEGHLVVIVCAVCALRTSGAPCIIVFILAKQTLMKACCTHYEHVRVYVDDLMFIGKKLQEFFDSLATEHGFKLKGVGKPSYHLGGDGSDSDGNIAWGVQWYIEKMIINYEIMFGCKTKECSTPMAEKDFPEINNSYLLDIIVIKQCQSLIGAL
jgi:hypothetical protein